MSKQARTFDEDFAAALQGDVGYRGIEPKTAAALYRLGLITEAQAWEGARAYEEDWKMAWDTSDWWWGLAEIASQQYRGFWTQFSPSFSWKSNWIRERRGW